MDKAPDQPRCFYVGEKRVYIFKWKHTAETVDWKGNNYMQN